MKTLVSNRNYQFFLFRLYVNCKCWFNQLDLKEEFEAPNLKYFTFIAVKLENKNVCFNICF